MYSAMSRAERPVAARISLTDTLRACSAAICRKSCRYRRIEPSEWCVRSSMSVNCSPHRCSYTTVALCDNDGPMSRTWPRVGTDSPSSRSTARSRLIVAGDDVSR
jgi:hypothetical protein